MLNQEEVLIKLMQLLDIDLNEIKLKQTSEKQRFITQEESNKKYQEHLELIFDALKLDKKNEELFVIFQDLLFIYNSIYQKLLSYVTKNNIEKINWILLKRLVVPFLAYRFANLDANYNKRIDKNMPGGIFWYLPNIDDPKNIKMPIQFLMDWWLDLYGKGLDSLCNEIDTYSSESDAFSSKNILKEWKYQKVTPTSKSLKQYLRKKLKYTGIFNPTKTVEIHRVYLEALNFVRGTKKLSLEELKKELPNQTLLREIYSERHIKVANKKEFIKYVNERWSKPGRRGLITKFLIARAVQDLYRRLIDYFEFYDSNDIEENKVLQLVYQYIILYNMEMARSQNKLNTNDISYPLYYEMMQPFYSPINDIIDTIGGDITIELVNLKYKENVLEDNHLLKMNVFVTQQDDRLRKIENDIKDHFDYFHKKFDDIDEKTKHYDFSTLTNEEDFELLLNLYRLSKTQDYLKAEKICFQMANIAKDKNQEIHAISNYLGIYCDVSESSNKSKYNEAKALLEQLILLLKDEYDEKKVFLLKANFHFKANEFNESLKYYDQFFTLYIDKQKKEAFSHRVVYLAVYIADSIKDEEKFKKYNKYLKKHELAVFQTKQSLPFPIYFYN